MATRIIKTQVTGTSTQKFTLSCWIKKSSTPSNDQVIYDSYADGNNRMTLYFNGTTGNLSFYGDVSGTTFVNIKTNRLFRDTSGWFNIVLRVDTTQGNVSHRVRIYVNGVEETSFATASYPTTGFNLPMGTSSYQHAFGWYSGGGSSVFDGSMSHLNFIDGEDRTPDFFGATDSTTGEWAIKTVISGVNYGNNGFFILKDGNSLTDQSGKGNNFTLNTGTLTKTEDCPSNVFCTMNPLVNVPDIGFSEGNTKITNNNNGRHFTNYGTLGFSTGKYYWEAEASVPLSTKWTIGLSDVKNQSAYQQTTAASMIVGNNSNSYVAGDAIGWYMTTMYKNGSTVASGLSIASGDRMMIACDADNGKIYFGKNGTWRVANSTTFDAAQNDTTFTTGESYTPAFSNEYCGWKINFGNGYFGTTAVSSAGTNASNNGIFEYDVPTGYTALSTKGLNL